MKKILIIFFFLALNIHLFAEEGILKNISISTEIEYAIILNNGDILTGYILEFTRNEKNGEGIKFDTELGEAIIFEKQIKRIYPVEESNRHSHRVFLLPTAKPIGNNHFIGAFELLFFYAGFGIGDIVSITAGRTVVPQIRADEQFMTLNGKVTLLTENFDNINRSLSLAVGGNLAFINDRNRLVHYYGVGTFELSRTSLHASVFYKAGSQDINDLYFGVNHIEMLYPNGAFGIGLGVDSRLSNTHGLYFIGELWNNNIQQPTNTAILLGLRLCNQNFSAEFGLSFFTTPFFAPFTSFVWTPF